ncbi:MAG: homoserine dehydrogenase [Coleofasciculaceae cyanobacterium RL_1_1]|nr:homoserine dehydrogenase [Coleofasciculaceae cyanobacterium RL_1_1]
MGYNVGLLGLGTVGTGTAKIIMDSVGRHPLLEEISIVRVGVRTLDKARAVEFETGVVTDDLASIVTDPNIDIIVELIGGVKPALNYILTAIEHGKHVVTANKAVISRHGDEIFTAANAKGVYVLLEAAVAGGIPVLTPLKQALGVNRINRVTGIINGTTNYILTRMKNEGVDFDEVLADAQRLGYAEADPTADVDGLDAADKIAILASLAFGGRIKLDDVYCEGIRKISAADIAYAEKLGFTIKLLAIAQGHRPENGAMPTEIELKVHPTLLPKHHPLATVDGVNNAVLVEADPLGEVMFYGPGAGEGATASAVVSDIVSIVAALEGGSQASNASGNPLLRCSHEHYTPVAPMDASVSRFYARILTQDRPSVIGHIGLAFGDHGVSLESVVQIDVHDRGAEIVVITHKVNEGKFQAALTALQALEEVVSVPSVLRVW